MERAGPLPRARLFSTACLDGIANEQVEEESAQHQVKENVNIEQDGVAEEEGTIDIEDARQQAEIEENEWLSLECIRYDEDEME